MRQEKPSLRERGAILVFICTKTATATAVLVVVFVFDTAKWYGALRVAKVLCTATFFFFASFIPFIILAQLSPSLPVVTQMRGHTAGPPPSSPPRFVPAFLSREDLSISSLVDSRRIVCTINCMYFMLILLQRSIVSRMNYQTTKVAKKAPGLV